jgi:flagellar basal-body rod protein FlgG
MIRAMMTAASGMKAQQMQVDTIANNLANVNTTGFKKNDLAFREMLYETIRDPGSPTGAATRSPTGLQVGSGTEIGGSVKAFRQGEITPTGNPFDLSLTGPGFFRVKVNGGEFRYTRDGSFRLDENNSLVTSEGYSLDPAVTLPPNVNDVSIGVDGSVSVTLSNSGLNQSVTKIDVFRFANPSGLKAQGDNLYSPSDSSGTAQQVSPGTDGAGEIRQGYLERSNVSAVDELVGLILAQRNYEINSRAIKVSDEMLQQVNQLIR